MQFDTSAYTMAPLPKMRVKIQTVLDHWRCCPMVTARDLHPMLGMLTYMATLVPRGRLHLRQSSGGRRVPGDGGLVRPDPSYFNQSPSGGSVGLSCSVAGVSLSALETELTLFTDASSHGWGAQLGSRSLQRTWSHQQGYSAYQSVKRWRQCFWQLPVSCPNSSLG